MIVCSLGTSGSGKTVYLSSLMDNLFSPANSIADYYLSDIDDADYKNIFEDILDIDKISLNSNIDLTQTEPDFSGFPAGTRTTVAREFSLRSSFGELLPVTWVDYKGGLISNALGSSEEMQGLYGYLEASSALVVFVDGYRIAHAESTKQARLHTDANKIAQVVSHMIRNFKKTNFSILFVVTQIDAIEDLSFLGKEKNWEPLIAKTKETYDGVIKSIKLTSNWKIGMVAVSAVGMGNNVRTTIKSESSNDFLPNVTKDKIVAYPAPVNIVESFFWLASQEMLNIKPSYKQIDAIVKKVHAEHNSNKKTDRFSFFKKQDPEEIRIVEKRVEAELSKLSAKLIKDRQSFANELSKLSKPAIIEL